WRDHPPDDGYGRERRPDLSRTRVPASSVLGWFDDFSSGTARLIEAVDAEAVCGPWAHIPWGTRLGDVQLGDEASPAVAHRAMVAFFDRVLKGVAESPPDRIRYHSAGSGWRTASSWPPSHRLLTLGAASGGNANSRHGDGQLGTGAVD